MTRSGLFTPVANPATSKAPLVADVSPVPTTPLDDIQELSEGASPTNLPMPGAEMLFDAPSHAETSTGANDSDDAKNQMLKRS